MLIDKLEFKNRSRLLVRLNQFDTRCRLLAGIVCIAITVNLHNWILLAALICLVTILLVKDIKIVMLRLIPVNIFAAMLWITFPLGIYLSALINMDNNIPDYSDAFQRACLYTLRINAAALLYMLLIIPLGIGDLSNTLLKLYVPKKLVTLLMLTYRYIYVLMEKVLTASLSLRIRKPKRFSKLTELRCYGNMFGTSILSAELRASKVWIAMRSRGFTDSFPLTKDFTWTRKDTILIVVCIVIMMSLSALDVLWSFQK
jgi:cobalt/nickel transport system permease protein